MATMTQPKLFRKKPVEIKAIQWDGTDESFWAIQNFTQGKFRRKEDTSKPGTAEVYDELHDTWVELYVNHWIIRGVQGEFYPCDDTVFASTYDKVNPHGFLLG